MSATDRVSLLSAACFLLILKGLLKSGQRSQGQDNLILVGGGAAPTAASATAILPTTLGPNHPNPFNATTLITYDLSADGQVKLEVFDVLGRRVTSLVDEFQIAGAHQVAWDGTDAHGNTIASGMYFARLVTRDAAISRKMVLLK